MNKTILGLALFLHIFTLPAINGQTIDDNLYCNSDYHFCVEFPASILTIHSNLIQDKGILLQSKDGFSQMSISISPQPENATTKDVFLSYTNSKTGMAGKDAKIISSLFGEDFYECFFMIGLDYFYHKNYHFDDYYVRIEIKAPINMPDKMQVIRQQVNISFDEIIPALKATSSIEEGRSDK